VGPGEEIRSMIGESYRCVRGLCGVSRVVCLAAVLVLGAVRAHAGELIYQPVNPSFGGNPFNSSHLLATANAQNGYPPPSRRSPAGIAEGSSNADRFIRQLEGRLLSGLASELTNAIFGNELQERGKVVFGEQTITFERTLESIDLVIEDASTGATTEISVPVLQVD